MFRSNALRRATFLAPAAFFALTAPTAASTTLPPRKPGFWVTTMTMKMTMPGMPAGAGDNSMVTAMCTDAETDALEMKRMTGDNGSCQSFDIEGGGNTYTMTGVCKDPMGGGAMTTHGVFHIISANEMQIKSTTVSAHVNGSMTGDSKWAGACPAGVVPGDLGRMENGTFEKLTNLKDMPKTP